MTMTGVPGSGRLGSRPCPSRHHDGRTRLVRIMSFFTDTPRALAVGPGGNTVFVAGFKTGNQTSIVNEGRICSRI